MDPVSISVSFIVAILGIAYPLLFQVITGFDEKYSSLHVLDIFRKESVRRYFEWLLIISLILILIWILKLKPLFQIDGINLLINNSALLLLLVSTVALIVAFFFLVKKILIYYSPIRLTEYLIKEKYNNEIVFNDNKSLYFQGLSDLLYLAIRNQNKKISKTVSDFIYKAFKDFREKADEPIEYPKEFYELVNKTTIELANSESKELKYLEYRSVGGLWFLGELDYYELSETTYSWLWRNLLVALKYEEDDMIVAYWENAYRFFDYQLKEIQPVRDEEFNITNQDEIDKRDNERERFLEFQYALGGLLLYRERYSCLNRMFKYTNSQPPKYVLLPDSMDDIFKRYFQFRDPYHTNFPWITRKYSFPGTEGIQEESFIKKWICQYIAVLLLRQYSITPYLSYQEPLQLPSIPETQGEKRLWIDNLDYFKSLVKKVYQDEELKQKLSLGFLNDEWCENEDKPTPLEVIENTKTNLIESFETAEVEQEVSPEKAEEFFESSREIMREVFNQYEIINNREADFTEFQNWFINGETTVIDKNAFSDNQGFDSSSVISYLGNQLSRKFRRAISETFYFNITNSYLLSPSNLFEAIDHLNINKDEYRIISFGIRQDYYKNSFGIEGLSESDYKGIPIINLSNYNYEMLGQSLLIIKKDDLPKIIHHELEQEVIEEYFLDRIDEEFNIYASIVDLNQEDELREEMYPKYENRNLRKSVVINLLVKTEIRWDKNTELISLKAQQPTREEGLSDELDDIEAINQT